MIIKRISRWRSAMAAGISHLVAGYLVAGFLLATTANAEGMLRYATVGEPPSLDQHVVTSDLASTIAHHMFEGLYTFNAANACLLYTSPSPRDKRQSRMPSSA